LKLLGRQSAPRAVLGTVLITLEVSIVVHRLLVPIVALLAVAAPALAQTTGPCSDELSAERRQSPVVLHFAPEQSALRTDDEKKIAQLARLARSHQVQEICIQGFMDVRGDPTMNEELSLSRGHAVANALRRHGVDPRRIVIDPKGEPGTSIAGFLNGATGADRRIEVRFTRY
jgi:outer membrane protein OmpA-like peptidoglycan-associated protein